MKREIRLWGWLLLSWLISGLAGHAAGPEPAGWYAGDVHVHRSCGGAPISVSSIYNAMVQEDLSVVCLLADMGNGEVQNATTDLPRVGQDDPVSTPGRIIHWDAEWHWDATFFNYPYQALGGHIVALGLKEAHQIWEEYTYPIFQWSLQQNGIAGFAHLQFLGDGIPQSLNCCIPIEYPVEVALGSCDFISEDIAGSDSATRAYYRLLNCGFRPGFAGGSDYPCNANLGAVITYVKTAGALTYRSWIEGIANGRTVVSRNGHDEFLELKVNNSATPGDEIKLAGAGNVQVSVQWTANQALNDTIELVRNGAVVSSTVASVSSGSPATLNATVNFAGSGWLIARRMSNRGHEVHTSAVFVTVNNTPVRASVSDATFYVAWMDALLQRTSPGGIWYDYFLIDRDAAQARYQAAKSIFEQIAMEAAGQQPLAISTTGLPGGALKVSYSAALAASGGTMPFTWSIVSGSLPPGLTLNASSGSLSGIPSAIGSFSFTARVSDASNPVQTATKALSINTTSLPATVSIWPSTAVPGVVDGGADSPVELGVKFQSDVSGTITGIKYYKASANTGAHVGNLWSSTGTLLATATFAGESSSGWQQVIFATPVAISANTVYVASYHANTGHYSEDQGYFSATGVDNAPLHALADGAAGGNSVYAYGASSTFPAQTWNAANYWVDVVFQAGSAPNLVSIAIIPANPSLSTGGTQQFTATGTYSNGSTQNITSQATWSSSTPAVATINAGGLATAASPGNTTISAALSGVTASSALTVKAQALAISTTSLPNATANVAYSATLAASGGTLPLVWSIASGSLPSGLALSSTSGAITGTPSVTGSFNFTVRVNDSSTPSKTATKALSISVTLAPTTISIWPATAVPVQADFSPDSAAELGVKFRSDVDGKIHGIRFYKASTNTGVHVGNLWSSTGALLATATFTAESVSGWQKVTFSTPVAILANTDYVASYHTNNGHYSEDLNYFTTGGVDNGPLHALADGVSGGNGVYAYGASSVFPTQSWQSANYWVDVLFQPGTTSALAIKSASLANGAVNVGYSATLAAGGGTTPYSWGVAAGALPTGLVLNASTGVITGTPTVAGTFNFTARVTDASKPVQSVTRALSIIIGSTPANTSLWPSTAIPGVVDAGPDSAVEVGVKFRSDLPGFITGIRFYKASTNTGTHVGNLWTSTGTLLATATFNGESASGWQQVNFASPVAISANVVYVASYHTDTGHYCEDLNYFATAGVDNAPLHALANGESGPNSVYVYGAGSAFPSQTWMASNFWVDVVFHP